MPVFNLRVSPAAIVLLACVSGVGGASAAQLMPIRPAPNSGPADDPISWVPFPTAGDAYCSATDGCGTIPSGGNTASQWTTGDYVLSSVFTLPTNSVTDLTADWSVLNDLGNGAFETWYVYVNGTAVAQATLNDNNFANSAQSVTGTVNFADIAPVSGGYQVELILQNTVAPGDGAIVWQDGGMTGLSYSAIPEPSTWAMMLLGFAGLGFAGYRGAKRAPLSAG